LIRTEILEAKKLVLLDLCKAYGLDPTGTKEQLRERLLTYLDEHEVKEEPQPAPAQAEAPAVEEAPVAPSAPVTTATPTPSEPIAEPVKTPPKLITAAPRMVPDIPRREMPPVIWSTAPPVEEPQPSRPIVVEPYIPPTAAAGPQPASIAEGPTIPVARVEHPCPRCGRELTYIPRSNGGLLHGSDVVFGCRYIAGDFTAVGVILAFDPVRHRRSGNKSISTPRRSTRLNAPRATSQRRTTTAGLRSAEIHFHLDREG